MTDNTINFNRKVLKMHELFWSTCLKYIIYDLDCQVSTANTADALPSKCTDFKIFTALTNNN